MKDSEIQELHEKFRLFDIEGNGIITVSEMKKIMSDLGIKDTEQEIEELIKNLKTGQDMDDMHINYSEFIAATLDRTKYLNEEKLWQIFQYYDTDKSGEITLSDFPHINLTGP